MKRSIPTHVGFTWKRECLCLQRLVHPHARGVYFPINRLCARARGPSPRTWGLLSGLRAARLLGRSIPTHVGFTMDEIKTEINDAVHPHARGVSAGADRSGTKYSGPSPSTWGLRVGILPAPRRFRSIPTHVGFTASCRSARYAFSVHPHARGVYDMCQGVSCPHLRSIPTHVGFTPPTPAILPKTTVHPHARGVYSSW